MTCDYFLQPLNHFELPIDRSPWYSQRYCVYDDFVMDPERAPVFFYTGNESPLEQYINATGLMWELGKTMRAQIVFVEHRYEGKSKPPTDIPNCMAYSSSIQAIADYARFIQTIIHQTNNSDYASKPKRPVIAFGGSYGGMLSAWLRMKYPNTVAGAISASAPIWGFPLNFPTKIDTAYRIISDGLRKSYPPTEPPTGDNHCAKNFLVAQSLIKAIGESSTGRNWLRDVFSLCDSLTSAEDVDALLSWIQAPWFDFAEGSFPYPSSYISFALTHQDIKLPAWPLQTACWKESRLHEDLGFSIAGSTHDVVYDVVLDEKILVSVDWGTISFDVGIVDAAVRDPSTRALMQSVRDAVSVWYNITKDVHCFELIDAPNMKLFGPSSSQKSTTRRLDITSDLCRTKMEESGSWPALCCNEEMDLIITEASGIGNDVFWPPSHERGVKSHADIQSAPDHSCDDPTGDFGFKNSSDHWATWMDTYYGGTRVESFSNIIFSNGLLDPWSGAGVFAKGKDPWHPSLQREVKNDPWEGRAPGLYVQNITSSSDDSLVAILMEHGGHHTDLMHSHKEDPPCITEGRLLEREYIKKWIKEWWSCNEVEVVL